MICIYRGVIFFPSISRRLFYVISDWIIVLLIIANAFVEIRKWKFVESIVLQTIQVSQTWKIKAIFWGKCVNSMQKMTEISSRKNMVSTFFQDQKEDVIGNGQISINCCHSRQSYLTWLSDQGIFSVYETHQRLYFAPSFRVGSVVIRNLLAMLYWCNHFAYRAIYSVVASQCDADFLADLQDHLETAELQRQLCAEMSAYTSTGAGGDGVFDDRSEAIHQLTHGPLLCVSDLFTEFADPYDLHESKLLLLRFAGEAVSSFLALNQPSTNLYSFAPGQWVKGSLLISASI